MRTGWCTSALTAAVLSAGCEDDITRRVPLQDAGAPPGDAEPADGATNPDAGVPRDGGGPDGGLDRCGGFFGPCPRADQYCDFVAHSCGITDESGVCRPRPAGCSAVYEPVCGCDGRVYGNACLAHTAGWDVSTRQGCLAPQGFFRCGYRFCDRIETYCRHTVSSDLSRPDTFECPPLPLSCNGNATCGCVLGELCADTCTEVVGGGVILTCAPR